MMDLGQINRWRDLASKIAAAFCVIALLGLVDGLLVHFREPANLVKVLPGASVEINGELTDEAHNVEDLTFNSDSNQLQVTFEALHKGYFLGGDMWRGRLNVGPGIAPGEYSLSVIPRRTITARKAPAFRIIVFPEALSLQKSSTSLIRRWFGFSAFYVSAGCLPGILLAFGAVYWLSGKREALLAASGRAEIYRVHQTEQGIEISFGLGRDQGLEEGTRLNLFDKKGQSLGTVEARSVTAGDAKALVAEEQGVRPGYWLSKVS